MKPTVRLLATLSALLIAALLVACAAPAAAPPAPAPATAVSASPTAPPLPPTAVPPTQAPATPAAPTAILPTWTPAPPTSAEEPAAQPPIADPIATAKAWVNSVNQGDVTAALALMTQDARFQGAFTQPAPNVLRWWIDLGAKNVVPTCVAQDDQVMCTYVHSDPCIAAFGATGGLRVKMTFTMQDGKIQELLVERQGDEWASYEKWSDAEIDWVKANRAEEAAKIDFETFEEGGAIASELCQEFAATQPTPTPVMHVEAGKVTTTGGKITSQALAGNLLGDPTTRTYFVLLPPGYTTSERRYPVVYVLHGFTGDATSLVEDFRDSYQAALNEGDVQEMIFVFPDASNKLGGSYYLSSPTVGDYETYISQEFVKQIDSTYRTIPNRASRGISGCSMGGDGSMYLALKYPDVFSIVAPASGRYDWAHDGVAEAAQASFTRAPKDFSDFQSMPFPVQVFMAEAAGAASDPGKPPFYLDMPVVNVDGESQIVPEVAEKIDTVDSVHELADYLAQPERLNAILIYHGNNDDMAPVELAQSFDKLLTDKGVGHEYLEVSGTHCYFGSQNYVPVVQFMSDHLVGEEQP